MIVKTAYECWCGGNVLLDRTDGLTECGQDLSHKWELPEPKHRNERAAETTENNQEKENTSWL